MNIRPTIVPAGELLEHIAALLAKRPYEVPELARLTGFTVTTVRWRLGVLEQDGRAHQVRDRRLKGQRYRWIAGPAPACHIHVMHDDEDTITIRRNRRTPARDPLVAALFGPAKPAGKLLGAGSVLGGEG